MGGKVQFRGGQFHPSRKPPTKDLTRLEIERLLELAQKLTKTIPKIENINRLIVEIFKSRELKFYLENKSSKKDIIAELKAIIRIKNENDFFHALRACDIDIFNEISRHDAELSCKRIEKDGVFIDENGTSWNQTTQLEIFTKYQSTDPKVPKLRAEITPYLPNGVNSIKDSTARILAEVRSISPAKQDNKYQIFNGALSGPAEKTFQLQLVHACINYRRSQSQKIKLFDLPMIEFAKYVFELAGMVIGNDRIRDLLKKAQKNA